MCYKIFLAKEGSLHGPVPYNNVYMAVTYEYLLYANSQDLCISLRDCIISLPNI